MNLAVREAIKARNFYEAYRDFKDQGMSSKDAMAAAQAQIQEQMPHFKSEDASNGTHFDLPGLESPWQVCLCEHV